MFLAYLAQNIPGAIRLQASLLTLLSTVHVSCTQKFQHASISVLHAPITCCLASFHAYTYYCIYCVTLLWFVNSRGLALQCSSCYRLWPSYVHFKAFIAIFFRAYTVCIHVAYPSLSCSFHVADRVFYEIYRHKHEGELPCTCILHKTRGFLSCYNYVFYITTTPYQPCNKSHTIPEGTVWLLLHACNLDNVLVTLHVYMYDLLKLCL